MATVDPTRSVPAMTGTVLRIVVAAPLEGARQTLRRLAEERCGWKVVGEGSDGLSAISRARTKQADVILVDGTIEGPGLSGIRSLVPATSPFVVVGLVDHPAELAAAGTTVLKSAPAERIRQTVVEAVQARMASA